MYNFCILHLISSIQTPKYLVHCCKSNDIHVQCAQVVPPEAEKHISPYIFYGIPLTAKNSKCELTVYKTWIICAIALLAYPKNVIIAHSKPTRTSCWGGYFLWTPQREWTILIITTISKPVQSQNLWLRMYLCVCHERSCNLYNYTYTLYVIDFLCDFGV